jgi:hypothetical protein
MRSYSARGGSIDSRSVVPSSFFLLDMTSRNSSSSSIGTSARHRQHQSGFIRIGPQGAQKREAEV